MLKLDNNLLQEIGLGGLPEDQKKAMLQHIYETLELRVGTNLANQMTDAQLQEFERFIDAGGDNNQAEALKWLETNLPNYKQVVQQVFEQLKNEIAQMAPQIMASSGQPAATASTQDPAGQQPMGQPVYAQPPSQPSQPNYDQPAPQPYQQQPQPNPGMASQPQFAQPQPLSQPPHAAPMSQPTPLQQQPAYDQPQPMQQPQPMPPQWQPPQPPATDDQTAQQPPQAA